MNNLIKFMALIVLVTFCAIGVIVGTAALESKTDKIVFEKDEYCRALEQQRAFNGDLVKVIKVLTGGRPVLITAYNAHPSQTDDTPTITASGASVQDGVLALSRDFLKRFDPKNDVAFGDSVLLIIPMKVEDTMNIRYFDRADIFMWDYEGALEFGVKEGSVYY